MRFAAEGFRPRGLCAALAVAAWALAAAAPLAAQDVVSFAKPLRQTAPVAGSLVSVFGDVTVDAPVARDLIVLGGDAVLSPAARIHGSVLVLGGRLRAERGDVRPLVSGEIHTVEALEAAFLSEVETSPAGVASPGILVSLRLALLALWLVTGSLLLFLAPRRVAAAAETLPGSAALDALLGAVALLSGALLSAFLLAALPARLALFGTGVVLLALLAAKAFGLAVLFLRIGRRIASGAARGSALWGDPAALALGLLALGLVSLVPFAGRILWMAVSLVAIGVALGTGFGKPLAHLTLSARRA